MYVIRSSRYVAKDQNRACGLPGTLAGFWLKVKATQFAVMRLQVTGFADVAKYRRGHKVRGSFTMGTCGRLAAMLAAVGVLGGVVLAAGPARADKRVALVIGNGGYRNAPRLANPPSDARDVGEALKRSGFETVVGINLDKAAMDSATVRFSRLARDSDVAIFYYSGHAMQYNGLNYLLPVDARLNDEADLRLLPRVDDIVADLQRAKRACASWCSIPAATIRWPRSSSARSGRPADSPFSAGWPELTIPRA
jgi:caspase domain-containing protein